MSLVKTNKKLRIRVRYKGYVGNWFDYLLVSRNELKEI
jgi:hypothetical protein